MPASDSARQVRLGIKKVRFMVKKQRPYETRIRENENILNYLKQKPHRFGAVVVVGGPGLEPGTFTLSAGCSNQLS